MDDLFQIPLSQEDLLPVLTDILPEPKEAFPVPPLEAEIVPNIHIECVKVINDILRFHVILEENTDYQKMRDLLRTLDIQNFLMSNDLKFALGIELLYHPFNENVAAIINHYNRLKMIWGIINLPKTLMANIEPYIAIVVRKGFLSKRLTNFHRDVISAYWLVSAMAQVMDDANRLRNEKWAMALYWMLDVSYNTYDNYKRMRKAKDCINSVLENYGCVPRWWWKTQDNSQLTVEPIQRRPTNQTNEMLHLVETILSWIEDLGADPHFIDMMNRLRSEEIEQILTSSVPQMPPDVPDLNAPVIEHAAHIVRDFIQILKETELLLSNINEIYEMVEHVMKRNMRGGQYSRLRWFKSVGHTFNTIYWKIRALQQIMTDAKTIDSLPWACVSYYMVIRPEPTYRENLNRARGIIFHLVNRSGLPTRNWLDKIMMVSH